MGYTGTGGIGGTGGTVGASGIGSGGSVDGGVGTILCDGDADCSASVGPGSLCLGGACTKVEGCDRGTLVVVDQTFAEPIETSLGGACSYRTLAAADAALVVGTTHALAIYAANLSLVAPFRLRTGVSFEGHGPGGALVALSFAVASYAPLLTIEADSSASGFALDGRDPSGGDMMARGVVAEGGKASVRGPFTITRTFVGLEPAPGALLEARGTQAAPVRLFENVVGALALDGATLKLEGDGEEGGLIIEGNTDHGVLVGAGDAGAPVMLKGILARNNGGEYDGGAITLRRDRLVEIADSVFRDNKSAIIFDGGYASSFDAFADVKLRRNAFWNRPSGSVLFCGINLSTVAQIKIGAGSSLDGFDLWGQSECDQLESSQQSNCNYGGVLGYDYGERFDFYFEYPPI